MVVAFHSFIAYLGSQPASPHPFDSPPFGWTANPIIDSQRWFGFDLFCASQYVYLMHLMFFLSGLFVWPSLLRRGAKTFLHGRVIRLGVPFILGIYLLMPVTYYADLVRAIKRRVPGMHVHAFSPMEISNGVTRSGISTREWLISLREAGLGSIPGTAAEILDERVIR